MRHLTRPSLSYACVIRFCTASGPRSTGGAGMQARVSIDRHSYARDASPKPRQTGMGRSQTRNQGLIPEGLPFGGDPQPANDDVGHSWSQILCVLLLLGIKHNGTLHHGDGFPFTWIEHPQPYRFGHCQWVYLCWISSPDRKRCVHLTPGFHRQPTRTCCSDSTRWAVMAYPVLTTSRT